MTSRRKTLRRWRTQWRYGLPNRKAWVHYLFDVAVNVPLCGHPHPRLLQVCDRREGHTGYHASRSSLGPRWWRRRR